MFFRKYFEFGRNDDRFTCMLCPVCREILVVFEYRNIELDYCPDCGGVWFDSGEVELLMETVGIDAEKISFDLKKPERSISEARRRCPACDKIMEKVCTPDERIILDQCPFGDGIWFDAGEISGALSSLAPEDESGNSARRALADFLGEALNNE